MLYILPMTFQINIDDKKQRTANSRLPQWGLTWLNEVQCFCQCTEIPTAASGKTLTTSIKYRITDN